MIHLQDEQIAEEQAPLFQTLPLVSYCWGW